MTGLDKMVSQILEEANNSAKAKVNAANAQADEIKAAAEAEADKLVEEIRRKSEADIANYKERVKSSSDLKRRTALLTAKQQMISQVIDKACEKFSAKEEAEYFQTLKDMLEKFVQPQEGILYLSPDDLAVLPADFATDVTVIAAKKGGALTISKEGRKIGKGFVLSYGGIEENCSFTSLFDAKRDELQDKVQKILFS